MRKNETDTYKKMKEDKRKRDFIRPRLVFRVKKITSVITGVLGRKKKHLQVKTEEREMILQKKLLKLMRPWLLLKQRLETTRRRCLIPLEICHIHFFSHGLITFWGLRRQREKMSSGKSMLAASAKIILISSLFAATSTKIIPWTQSMG
ncbi:hypothetical protein YC2023_025689 [Brassica napus]